MTNETTFSRAAQKYGRLAAAAAAGCLRVLAWAAGESFLAGWPGRDRLSVSQLVRDVSQSRLASSGSVIQRLYHCRLQSSQSVWFRTRKDESSLTRVLPFRGLSVVALRHAKGASFFLSGMEGLPPRPPPLGPPCQAGRACTVWRLTGRLAGRTR